MRMALNETVIEGIQTNIELHQKIMSNQEFKEYKHYIKFLEDKMVENNE